MVLDWKGRNVWNALQEVIPNVVENSNLSIDSLPLCHWTFNNVISNVPHRQCGALDETSCILNHGLMYGYSQKGLCAKVKRRKGLGLKVTLAICILMEPREDLTSTRSQCIVEYAL